MLTTPFLHPNPHFIAYNAIRGTVTFVNTQNLKHFPGHLLSMLSTQITAKHYFSMVDSKFKTYPSNTIQILIDG